jgi:hypothetical protein
MAGRTTSKKASRPGAKAARALGRRALAASKWTGRRVLAPGAKASGRYIAGRTRRGLGSFAGLLDDKRVRRAHTGSTGGAKIICACSDCKGREWPDRDAFKVHMTGSSSQYMLGADRPKKKVPAPSTARIGAVKPKPKPTTPAAERAAAFWNRSTPGMSQIAAFVKAAEGIAQTAPATADELEQMLSGLTMAYLKIADLNAQWAEVLDAEVGIDPKVTMPLYRGSDAIAESAKAFRDSKHAFRTLYAAQLEQANNGIRQPKSPDFFAA